MHYHPQKQENVNKKLFNTKLFSNEPKERLRLLYEKGKIKNKFKKIQAEKNEELRIQEETKECTFRPKINQKRDIDNKNNLEPNFYERLENWKKKLTKK